jgi:TRAP-type C4-dicarboxylate transport system substrate-binding protein
MKRLLLILVAVILVSGLASAPAPVSAEIIKLKFAHNYPPPTALGKTFTNWAQKIKEDTNGRVEITVYGAGSLIKPAEFYDATVTGVTDMAYGMLNQDMSRFGLDTGLCLAGLDWPQPWPNVDIRMRVYNELRQKFPIMGEKQKEVEVLFDIIMAPFVFHSPKKAVRTPKDIKGLRVAATGWYITLAKVLGAVPVALPGPERYMALEKGVIDGSWDLYAGMFAMKIIEVTNNYVEADFGDSSGIAIMSKEKFNALPPDIQKIFRDNREFGSQEWLRMGDGETKMALGVARKRGHTFITLTPEEKKLWYDALSPLREEWIKQQEARGLPARAFMDEMLRLIKKYR